MYKPLSFVLKIEILMSFFIQSRRDVLSETKYVELILVNDNSQVSINYAIFLYQRKYIE